MIWRILIAVLLMLQVADTAAAQIRIKDIASVRGVRSNHIVGYGLVVGLNGTGDSLRNAPFTQQSMQSMLDRMGVNIRGAQARTRNVAAVMVMAELPPFVTKGSRVDVTIASLGDATSLAGGSLLLAPLAGADDTIYAVAQGPVAVSGYVAAGKAETVTQGVPTAGRIPNGAHVERDAPGHIDQQGPMALELRNPDFKTAIQLVDAINAYSIQRFGLRVASEDDMRSVALRKPPSIGTTRFIAEIGELTVRPEVPARVIIDERSGTIVIGQDVRVSTVAVAHGSIAVRVTETPKVSQPGPFSRGETVVTPETTISVDERGGHVAIIQGTTLQSLVSGLNRMGLKPNGIIAVLQAIKTAGALQAELVVQ
jgi:flagellar P-ring protein precursor FlgI